MANNATVEMVRNHLLNKDVGDDARLPTERALAERFGVSRNVIRKALSSMEVEGQVVRRVGSGTYLVKGAGRRPAAADSSHQKAALLDVNPRQILEARFALEPSLASLAAMNCTIADLERLSECAKRYHDADSFEAYEAADQGFHEAIALATHNPVLISAYRSFSAANIQAEWGSIRLRFLTAERRTASRHEHDEIVSAIRDRDSVAAGDATRRHLQCIADALLRQ